MSPVVETLVGTSVRVAWNPLATNGSPITAYKIEIKQQDGVSYTQDLTDCDGTNPTTVAGNYCLIPMTTLTAYPYLLAQGSLIIARVSALNVIGWSTPSADNTVGVTASTTPA
jgi:hypothetical protein